MSSAEAGATKDPRVGAPTRGALWSGLALVAIVVAFWSERYLFGTQELVRRSSDLRDYFYPLYEAFYRSLAAGRLLLWNPYHLAGYPQIATLQGGFFYPPHVLYVGLPTHVALALSHVLHLAWLAVTTAWLLRRIGVGTLAAAFGALLFALGGGAQWWLLWPAMLEAGSWLPLGCIAILETLRGRRSGPPMLAFASGMTLLAGHTQVSGYLLWCWLTLYVALQGADWSGAARALSIALRIVSALIAGLAISAIQSVPTLELSLQGTRDLAGLPASQVLAMGLWRMRTLAAIVFDNQFAFGATALALVPAALLAGRHRAIAIWALFVAGASFGLASVSTPAGVELYRAIPGIGGFRAPWRILCIAQFAVALLAALGFDALHRRAAAVGSGLPAAAATASALAIAAGLAAGGATANAAIAAAVAGVAGVVWSARAPRRFAAVASIALFGCAALDIGSARTLRGRLPYRAEAAAVYAQNAAVFREVASRLGDDRALELPLPRSRDVKLAGLYGLRRLDDFEPLNLQRQAEYFDYFLYGRSRLPDAKRFFAGAVIPDRRASLQEHSERAREMAQRRRLLDLAAARIFLTQRRLGLPRDSGAIEFVHRAGLIPREPIGDFAIAENPHALPRAFVTYRTRPAPAVDALLQALSDESFDPLAASYVEGDPGLPPADAGPARGAAATLLVDEPHRVDVEAELAEPGLLVLADSFYPGWKARVDSRPAPIFATNHLYRGVPVPAGRHRISFVYRPTAFFAGAAISALSGAGLLVAAWRVRDA